MEKGNGFETIARVLGTLYNQHLHRELEIWKFLVSSKKEAAWHFITHYLSFQTGQWKLRSNQKVKGFPVGGPSRHENFAHCIETRSLLSSQEANKLWHTVLIVKRLWQPNMIPQPGDLGQDVCTFTPQHEMSERQLLEYPQKQLWYKIGLTYTTLKKVHKRLTNNVSSNSLYNSEKDICYEMPSCWLQFVK